MADKTGYIGRNPNDSAVTVARQFFTASGVTTTFTFASGYLTGFLDVYVDGVKRRVADEFTATDGSTFDVLQGGVSAGSTVEAVAYKAFNAAAISGDVTGNFDVSGNTTLGGSLSVTGGTTFSNINVTGIATLGAGTTVAFANTAFNLEGTPDITIASLSAVDINVSGAATIGGILTYEDVTNIDSLGIVTARTGVEVTANGLVVNAGVSTFAADVSVADKIVHTGDANTAIRFPSADTITAETAGSERLRISSGGDVTLAGIATVFGATGIVSATSFDGDLTGDVTGNLTGTASNASGATGDFSIADKIVHTGDTNTAIRFPAADTFTVETGGSEAIRVDSSQRLLVGNTSARETGSGFTAQSQVEGLQTVSSASFTITSNRDIDDLGGRLNFARSKGGAIGSNTIVDADAELGGLYFFGADGTDTNSIGAQINAYVDGTPGSNDMPGRLVFSTTADGASSVTERLRITSSGQVVVGDDTSRTNYDNGSVSSNLLHVERTAASGNTAISICANAGTAADVGSVLYMGRTSGTSNGANTIVESGDLIGRISFQGADGSQLVEAASIRVDVDGTPGGDDMPGRIEFYTTADGGTTETERLRIDSKGNIGVNQTSINSTRKMEITQPSSYTSGLRINSAGSAGNGAYYEVFVGSANYKFGGDHNTNALLFKKDGTEYMRHDSSGRLLIGHTSSVNISGLDSHLQVVGTTGEAASLSLEKFANDASEPFFIFAKSRNASKGGNTVVQDDDTLGRITFQGADGSDYEEAAFIKGQVDGAPAGDTTDMPGRLVFGTTADGDHNPTERLRITSGGLVRVTDSASLTFGNGDDMRIYHDGGNANYIDVYNKDLYIRCNLDAGITGGDIVLQPKSGENSAIFKDNDAVELYYDNSKKFETTSSGVTVTGTVTDSKGELRKLIANTQSGTYTLVAGDSGKYVWASNTVTIPNNVFSAGDMVTIVNDTNGNLTLTKDIATMYMSSDGTSANRTLSAYGMATILFVSGTAAYISGAGLS